MEATKKAYINQAGRKRGQLTVDRPTRERVHIAVEGPEPGIRVDVWLGADGRTVYLEAYHWFGQRQPIKVVSTVTGETIDLRQPEGREHPELAILEDGDLGPPR